jgi:hypothetical protein
MFLCKECHEKECQFPHFVKSIGRCESCGKVAECVDCHAYKKRVDNNRGKE